MPVENYGTIDSAQLVAAALAFATAVAELTPSETPFLSMVSPSLQNLDVSAYGAVPGSGDGTAGGAVSIKFAEKVYRVTRTTLNAEISAVATTIVLDDPYAGTDWTVQMGEETILLGETDDRLTFTGCERGTGTGVGAIHADGVDVLLLGKSFEESAPAATGGLVIEPDEVTNYLEIFQEVADVSGSARFLTQYYQGKGDKLMAMVAQHVIGLKHQLENRTLWGTAQARVGKTTPGRMDSVYERVAATSFVSMSDDLITYNDVQLAIRAMRKDGARPNAFFCSLYQADYFNNLGLASRMTTGSEAARMIYGTEVPALRIGDILLDIIAMDKFTTNALIATTNNIKVGPKEAGRHFLPEALGKGGDSDKIMIVGEYTNQVILPPSHFWFKNVKNAA